MVFARLPVFWFSISKAVAFPMDELNYAGERKIHNKDLGKANMSGNASKRRKKLVDARTSNTVEEKKTGKRIWSESDELLLLKGFGEYNSLHPGNETSFHSYVKDAISFNLSVDQLTHKLWKLKNKYEDTESRQMKDANNSSFVGSHQQKLFEASSKIWGRNSNWIRSEAKYFYHFLLSNYMADKGLDFAALDGATRSIFVEEWNNLMLARTYYLTLNAKFDKVSKCRHYVYKDCINSSPTIEDS